MRDNRPLAVGLVLAALSFVLTLGGIMAAAAENSDPRAGAASVTPIPFEFLTLTPAPASAIPAPSTGGQASPAATQTPLPSVTPSVACNFPGGWQAVVVGSGETLQSLAAAHGTTAEALAEGNCLLAPVVSAGSMLYVPNLAPSATQSPAPGSPCGPPASWVTYTIQSGDTLYSLAQAFGVSVGDLQFANCLGSSTYIRAGSLLWVPNVATRTPTRTQTATTTLTPTATRTFTPSPTSPPPSATQTATITLTPTQSATPMPTATETETATATATDTPDTPTATVTP